MQKHATVDRAPADACSSFKAVAPDFTAEAPARICTRETPPSIHCQVVGARHEGSEEEAVPPAAVRERCVPSVALTRELRGGRASTRVPGGHAAGRGSARRLRGIARGRPG